MSRFGRETALGRLGWKKLGSAMAAHLETTHRMQTEMQTSGAESVTNPASPFSYSDAAHAYAQRFAPVRSPERLWRYRVIKRAFDLIVVLALTPLWLPVMLAVAVAVRLTSDGPVFFSHRRIRSHGNFFSMWKFRTMCVNSQEVLEQYLASNPEAKAEWLRCHKLVNDPRVTPVGNFLRKTSLDELPQLWNVLTGSMTLVGPRPITAAEVEKYGQYFADYCMVKPGVTGLWQVSGRSKLSYRERVELDRQYARRWSLHGDLYLILRTVTTVVNGDGAY